MISENPFERFNRLKSEAYKYYEIACTLFNRLNDMGYDVFQNDCEIIESDELKNYLDNIMLNDGGGELCAHK